jgi:hypothetical protein
MRALCHAIRAFHENEADIATNLAKEALIMFDSLDQKEIADPQRMRGPLRWRAFDVYFNLALECFFSANDTDRAQCRSYCERILTTENCTDTYLQNDFARVEMKIRKENLKGAIKDLSMLYEFYGESKQTHKLLGEVYDGMGESEKSAFHRRKAEEL